MAISNTSNTSVKQIFCYGDSLTAGTSPPHFELFPYGPHLQKLLQQKKQSIEWKVNWFGLPGWTASSMVDNLNSNEGLNYHINKATFKPDLAIILSGTNDMAYQSPTDSDPSKITRSIIQLHKAAHNLGVPTLAVSIPPSSWQASNTHARNLAEGINTSLKDFCDSSQGKSFFAPFPITNFGNHDGEKDVWSPDGLHFSPSGYRVLGESLCPFVTNNL